LRRGTARVMGGGPLAGLAILAMLCALGGSGASAQNWVERPPDESEEGQLTDLEKIAEERRGRGRLYPMDQRIGRYLGAAAEATDEGDTAKANELMAKLDPKRLNPRERAQLYRLWAYVSYSGGDTDGAIENFRKVLEENIIPVPDEARIRFNIAQLYAGQQKWRETIAAIEEWEPWSEEEDPLAYYLKAIAYFQLDEMANSIPNAEKAIDLSPEPKEGWLQLLAALYVQEEDYVKATPVLEELVFRFPKKLYWVQLSLIYGAREKYHHSLSVQQVAYLQGLLTEDAELRRLARSYLFANLPYQAAKVLHKGLNKEVIEGDAEAYELLANSWIASREYDRSLPPLRKAADLSKGGKLFVRLGQVHLQREEWGEAAAMLEKAVAKGELDNPGNALLLLGISHYNDGQVEKARSYFMKALQHEKIQPQAERWLKHLETESEAADSVAGTPPN
jgi:tetratricopeptide (TPR) repeat protein